MPVRSLNSSVLKWPDRTTVHQAIEAWAERLQETHPHVQRVGYFGSYARGDWSVGSDVDVVLIVEALSEGEEVRGADVDATDLPVPADVVIYTVEEWEALQGRMREVLQHEVVWVNSPG